MSFQQRMAATAGRLAQAQGGQVTLRKVTAGAYNATTRRNATTTTDHDLGWCRLQAQVVSDALGNLVQTDKKEIVVPADQLPAGIVPLKSDLAVLNGQQYEVLSVGFEGFPPYEYKLAVLA